jgi:hypothetical protein
MEFLQDEKTQCHNGERNPNGRVGVGENWGFKKMNLDGTVSKFGVISKKSVTWEFKWGRCHEVLVSSLSRGE